MNNDAVIEILVAYIHVLENSGNSTASVDALAANVSVQRCSNLVPRVLSRGCVSECTSATNRVVFISCSEFGSEPKSRSLLTQIPIEQGSNKNHNYGSR